MNVSCPECHSVFRVDPAKVTGANLRARCSICGGLIPVGASVRWADEFPSSTTRAPEPAVRATVPLGALTPPSTFATMPTATPVLPPEPMVQPVVQAWAPTPPYAPPVVAAAPVPPVVPPVVPASAGASAPSGGAPVAPSMGAPAAHEDRTSLGAGAMSRPFAPPRRPTPVTPPLGAPLVGMGTTAIPSSAPSAAFETPSLAVPPAASPTPQAGEAAPVPPAGRAPVAPFAAPSLPAAPQVTPATSPAPASATSNTAPRRPINPFLSNDPNQKARRLARALVSDMVAYHPQKREEGARAGTLKQLFREEIKKSYEEYVEQVGREFAESTTHFQEALNDVLAGGKRLF